jgi:hypothetical protein
MNNSVAFLLTCLGLFALLHIKYIVMGLAWLGFASLQLYLLAFLIGLINMALKAIGIRINYTTF